MAKKESTNTGKKDAKGRAIYKGPRGGLYVVSGNKKLRPASGRVSTKALKNKARNLSAKRVALSAKAKNLSAKRVELERGAQFLEDEARHMEAQNAMRRLDAIVTKKAGDVKSATRKL